MNLDEESLKQLTSTYCPKQLTIFDNKPLLNFMEILSSEFTKLNLNKRFSARGLYQGIDFCYLHPIAFWTQTGISSPKRYPDELRAEFYVDNNQLFFLAYSPTEEINKSWPITMVGDGLGINQAFLKEVLAEFKGFYKNYHASKNW